MKTNKELQQEFWKFLRKKKLTTQFKKNNKISIKHDDYGSSFEDTLNNNISEIINHGFTWSETPEGQTLWDEINTEWRNYIEEISGELKVCGYPVIFFKDGESISVGCYKISWKTVKNIYKEILKLEK